MTAFPFDDARIWLLQPTAVVLRYFVGWDDEEERMKRVVLRRTREDDDNMLEDLLWMLMED